MTNKAAFETLYRTYRTYGMSIAYRMLGTYADAEDIVQDVFAELADKDPAEIHHMKSYIAKSVTNRCLNLLRSARKTREEYIGEWLPEPIAASSELPELAAEQKDTLSYAYLLMLERLSPIERAVFLLREVFEYGYGQIADMTGKTEANCRKILSRAKRQLQGNEQPASPPGTERQRAAVERFADAFLHFDSKALLELLAEDAVLISDGGGVARTAIRPIFGRDRILRLFCSPKAYRDMRIWSRQITELNGETAIVFTDGHGAKAAVCFRFTESGDRLRHVYMIKNPYKLVHLRT